VASSAAAVAAEVEEPTPGGAWILSRESLRKGETLTAWVALPAGAGTIRLRLLVPPDVEAWLPAGPGCRPRPARLVQAWSGPIAARPDRLVRVCARPTRGRSFRLAAALASSSSAIEPAVLASALVEVEPGWRLSTEGLALLLGFVAGIATNLAQRWIERLWQDRRSRADLQKLVADKLAGEWLEDRERLGAFLSDPSKEPPKLQVSGYNALLSDRGALAYLGAEERARYFRDVQALYTAIRAYNSLVDRLAAAPELRRRIEEAAQAIADRLQGSLEALPPAAPGP
jgi:hypothetical protein